MATMRVKSFGGVATFVVYRAADGHELSLSSERNDLVEFKGNKVITPHGAVYGPERFAAILAEFLAGESDHEPVNVYSRHPHRSA